LNEAGAGAEVVPLEGRQEISEAEAVGAKRAQIWHDMVLLHVAAVGVDLGDAVDALQLWPDHPVLDRAEIGRELDVAPEVFALRGQIGAIRLPAGLTAADGRPHAARMLIF